MRLPSKTLELKLFKKGYKLVIAIDEVGVAPLAGPVVVCATVFTRSFFDKHNKNLHYLRDSKQLLPHQREKYAAELLRMGKEKFGYKIAFSYPSTIDRLNVYRSSRVAMRRAVNNLIKEFKIKLKNKKINYCPNNLIVLVDGRTRIGGLDLEQIPIINGDRKIFSIACSSIIAKVRRDNMMKNYSLKYPGYGFEQHKGYPTKMHKLRLSKLGPCKIHRKSFAPVSILL